MPLKLRIIFSESAGEGQLECDFCPDGHHDLPYGIHRQGATTDPTADGVLSEHYDPGAEDDSAALPRCPNWNRWTNTEWTVRESDSGAVIEKGTVRVAKNGTIEVVTSR